jgi:hypothetical protein
MRKVAQLEAERRHLFELQLRQSGFLLVDGSQPAPVEAEENAAFELAEAGKVLAEDEALPAYRAAAAD